MKNVKLVSLVVAMVALRISESSFGETVQKAVVDSHLRVAVVLLSTDVNSDYRLTSASDGVLFDLDGSGIPRRIGWTLRGTDTALLATDSDRDGKITSGKELVTSRTVPRAPSCFSALQALAMQSNGGIRLGSVSSDDPLFDQLLLWRDSNHNGLSEPSELAPVSESFSAIGLSYQPVSREDRNGNRFEFRGWAHIRTGPGRNEATSSEDNDRRTRHIWQVYLATE
jgi:hypothetical protein